MKGRQYMDRMTSLLRYCYKSLEIALEDYPSQQSAPVAATARPRPAQLPDTKNGSVSVNMFDMGMCPASCAKPPTVPVPCPPVNDDADGKGEVKQAPSLELRSGKQSWSRS